MLACDDVMSMMSSYRSNRACLLRFEVGFSSVGGCSTVVSTVRSVA